MIAAARVFAIPELVEPILEGIHEPDDLVKVNSRPDIAATQTLRHLLHLRTVNSTFKEIIDRNLEIQTLILIFSFYRIGLDYTRGTHIEYLLYCLANQRASGPMAAAFSWVGSVREAVRWTYEPGNAVLHLPRPHEHELVAARCAIERQPFWRRIKLGRFGLFHDLGLTLRAQWGPENERSDGRWSEKMESGHEIQSGASSLLRPCDCTIEISGATTLGGLFDAYSRVIELAQAEEREAKRVSLASEA